MPAFSPVEKQPDHVALEHRTLERWAAEQTFHALQEQNRGGEPFSFFDGPITANNPMGVHHAWGRTLKDMWQRYHAMLGCDGRYQNGFDCQGLWVEVEVEKALGLNSKREIEEYGLDRFARACRDRVAKYAQVQTDQSLRLGQWMDWDRSYFTMTDANISYIWGFLKICQERDWLYKGHRSMPWCPRCGTSLSQHELIDSYKDITHPSLFVRFPLIGREHEYLAVWTTTPWTLPANVAAAVLPDADYDRVETAAGIAYVAASRREQVPIRGKVLGTVKGSDLVGLTYQGRSTRSRRSRESSTGWWPGRTCRWTRARGSSTSRPAAAPRTSSWDSARGLPRSSRSTSRAPSTTGSAGCTACTPPRPPSGSSRSWARRGGWSTPAS